jgi:hypothetical protein
MLLYLGREAIKDGKISALDIKYDEPSHFILNDNTHLLSIARELKFLQ